MSIKQQIQNYLKYAYPNTYNDFNVVNTNNMIMNTLAFIGDTILKKIDLSIRLSFISSALTKLSIYNQAQSIGYRVRTFIPSSILCILSCTVNDISEAPVIKLNMMLTDLNGLFFFRVPKLIDMSIDSTIKTVLILPGVFSNILLKKITAIASKLKQHTFTVNQLNELYLKIYLPELNIVDVISITDQNGDIWYLVPFLSEDSVQNTVYDTTLQLYIYNLIQTLRRFITRLDKNDKLYIQFGNGRDDITIDSDDVLYGRSVNTNYIKNNTYGKCPEIGTIFTITYTFVLSTNTNVASNVINKISNIDFVKNFNTTMFISKSDSSFGGVQKILINLIKLNVIGYINMQHRLVSYNDYRNKIRLIAYKYGYKVKSYTKLEDRFVTSYIFANNLLNANKKLLLCSNIKLLLNRFRLIGQHYNVKYANLINLKCKILLKVNNLYNALMVLLNTIDLFIKIMQKQLINYPLYISDIIQQLSQILGVLYIKDIIISQHELDLYKYNISRAKLNNVLYPPLVVSIFLIKNNQTDISGVLL